MKIAKICCDRQEKVHKTELYSVIPLVTEESLSHDESGYSYNSGCFMVMEAMMWNKALVTTRRLHKVPPPGAVVDMLVRESIYMSRLRHPNVLLLVAMCRTSNPESVVLLYERVYWGSLFQFLYQKYERMAVWEMCALMRQICSAVSYLHDNDLLHTAINSHAIHVVSQNLAKLGNFEYMVENNKKRGLQTKSMLAPSQQTSYLFHWTAPEILAEKPISEMTDLYSLCAVLWEILHGSIPWVGLNVEEIRCKMLIQKKRLQILEEYLEPPFNVILKQGLSIYPSCRKITVPDLQDLLTNIITNRDKINLSQRSVSPKKKTKMSMAEPKCKNHQRKSMSDQSLRVSFDDTDALAYEPTIKSSTPARKVQSSRPAKSDSPDVPPRRRKAQRSPVVVPQPEDIIQVSISSIEGSQKETSPMAFARSLSNGSRIQQMRQKLTQNLKPHISSDHTDHSSSVNEPTLSPTAVHLDLNTADTAFTISDANSSAVRRSLFQGPQPYKPSNTNLSSLTKVSFRPYASKDQLLNSSETSSLTQMPQLTSSSLSNGLSLSNHLMTTPSDSPIVVSRYVTGFNRPLQSSDPSFRLSKTLCGYTKQNLYDSKASLRQDHLRNVRPSQSDIAQYITIDEEESNINRAAEESEFCARQQSSMGGLFDSQEKHFPLYSTKSEDYESESRSPYLVRVISGRQLGSCEKMSQVANATSSRGGLNHLGSSSTEKMMKYGQEFTSDEQQHLTDSSHKTSVMDYQFKRRQTYKLGECKVGKMVKNMKDFFEQKADNEMGENLRNQSYSENHSFVEKEGYVRTPTGWVKSKDTPIRKVEKSSTPFFPGKPSAAIMTNESFIKAKTSSSLSMDQGIQTEAELPDDEMDRNCAESETKENRSWHELPCVTKHINSFQEIADQKKEKEEKLEAFFNKSLSLQAYSTTSSPQTAKGKPDARGEYGRCPLMSQENPVLSLSAKSSTDKTLGSTIEANEEFDVDDYEKAKQARDARIHYLREKYVRRDFQVETKKSNSDTLLEKYRPYSSEYNSRADYNLGSKSNEQLTTEGPIKTVQIYRSTAAMGTGSPFKREIKLVKLDIEKSDPADSAAERHEAVALRNKLDKCMSDAHEDSYFDDVLNPDVQRERHMRLQTTMELDQSSLLDNEIFDMGSPGADDTSVLGENNPDLSDLTLEERSSPLQEGAAYLKSEAEPADFLLERKDWVSDEGDGKNRDVQAKTPQVGEGDTMEKVDDNLFNKNNNASAGILDDLHCDISKLEEYEATEDRHEKFHHDEFGIEQCQGVNATSPNFAFANQKAETVTPLQLLYGQTDAFDDSILSQNNNSSVGFQERQLYRSVISELEETGEGKVDEEDYDAEEDTGCMTDDMDGKVQLSEDGELSIMSNADDAGCSDLISENDAANDKPESDW